MKPAGGTNKNLLHYDDLAIKAKQGDLIQSPGVEGRVYLVLDKHVDDDSKPLKRNTAYLSMLSPEGVTLSGSPELWYDMLKHGLVNNVGAENWKASMLFSILPRSTSSSTRKKMLPSST